MIVLVKAATWVFWGEFSARFDSQKPGRRIWILGYFMGKWNIMEYYNGIIWDNMGYTRIITGMIWDNDGEWLVFKCVLLYKCLSRSEFVFTPKENPSNAANFGALRRRQRGAKRAPHDGSGTWAEGEAKEGAAEGGRWRSGEVVGIFGTSWRIQWQM